MGVSVHFSGLELKKNTVHASDTEQLLVTAECLQVCAQCSTRKDVSETLSCSSPPRASHPRYIYLSVCTSAVCSVLERQTRGYFHINTH